MLLITDGEWTGADCKTPLAPSSENPALTASALYSAGVVTHVVAVGGDPNAEAAADETALDGSNNTWNALHGDTPANTDQALQRCRPGSGPTLS